MFKTLSSAKFLHLLDLSTSSAKKENSKSEKKDQVSTKGKKQLVFLLLIYKTNMFIGKD